VFSHNLSMYSSMVQSVFDEDQCMFIKNHLISVDQWVSLIFHKNKSYLIIISANMSDIRIMEKTAFTQFGCGEFIGTICFWWASMNFHQFSWWSLLFSKFPWFSIKKVTWYLFLLSWLTLELWNWLFSYNLSIDYSMLQSVFHKHKCIFINFHDEHCCSVHFIHFP